MLKIKPKIHKTLIHQPHQSNPKHLTINTTTPQVAKYYFSLHQSLILFYFIFTLTSHMCVCVWTFDLPFPTPNQLAQKRWRVMDSGRVANGGWQWWMGPFRLWLGLISVGCMRFLAIYGVVARFRSAWMGQFLEIFGLLWGGCWV